MSVKVEPFAHSKNKKKYNHERALQIYDVGLFTHVSESEANMVLTNNLSEFLVIKVTLLVAGQQPRKTKMTNIEHRVLLHSTQTQSYLMLRRDLGGD